MGDYAWTQGCDCTTFHAHYNEDAGAFVSWCDCATTDGGNQ